VVQESAQISEPVSDDADFAQGVAKGVWRACATSDNSCSAPTRILVPAARLAEVEALAGRSRASICVGRSGNRRDDMGRSPYAAQFDRVRADDHRRY